MFPKLYGSVCLKGAIKFYNGHEFSKQFKRLVEISIVNKSICIPKKSYFLNAMYLLSKKRIIF